MNDMKKIIFMALMTIGLSACEKEEVGLAPCNCGTIANDGIDTNGCHWLEIRNHCSGNKEVFCVDADVWMTAYVGTDFCVTNRNGW